MHGVGWTWHGICYARQKKKCRKNEMISCKVGERVIYWGTMSNQAPSTPEALLLASEFAAEGRRHVRFSYQGAKDSEPRQRELCIGQKIHAEEGGSGSWMTGHREGVNGWLIQRGSDIYISGFEVERNEKGHFVGKSDKPKCFRLDRVVF